jgi:hypothetical protein
MTDQPAGARLPALAVTERKAAIKDPARPRHNEALEAGEQLAPGRRQLFGALVTTTAADTLTKSVVETVTASVLQGGSWGIPAAQWFMPARVGQIVESFVRSSIPSSFRFAVPDLFGSAYKDFTWNLPSAASILGHAPFDFALPDLSSMWKWIPASLFPANLALVTDVELDDIDRLGQEGITVYCVPRAEIVRRLLDAADRPGRRRVLGEEFDRILDDCDRVLDMCVAESTRRPVPLLRAAITAARAGHVAPAQALATNTLDTLLQQAFSKKERIALTAHTQGRPSELDDLQIRLAWVMVPIWWSYRQFQGHAGVPAPAIFSRHATVHGVSPRQFSRRNAVQATMLATSLIAWRNGL